MRILGIGVVVAFALSGCSDTETNTALNPAGPPMVRQVFALELVMDGAVTRQTTQLAFGSHPDISGEDDDGQVTNAIALGSQRIRIVLDEIVRGNALEEIACADGEFDRVPIGATPDDIERCAGPRDAIALTCTGPRAVCTCPGPDPANPPVACIDDPRPRGVLDADEDGAADDFRFIEGAVNLECGGVPMALQTTGESSSFYSPSGNQQITAGPLGINSLGPAIVLVPRNAQCDVEPCGLRTGSNCTISFSPDVQDKDGNPICAPPGGDITQNCPGVGDTSLINFQVEPLRVTGTDPTNNATNIPVGQTVVLQFNANIDMATIGAVTLTDDQGTEVPSVIMVSTSDAKLVTINPDASLAACTTYTVTAETTVADTWGGTLPTAASFSFTTASCGPQPDANVPDAMVDAQVNDAQVIDAP